MAGMRLAMWFVLALTYELGHRAARGDSWVGVSTGQQFASAFTDPSFSTIYIEDDLMLRPGDWGLGCLPLTKNITVVGRAPSNTTYPVVHMGWLTRIIKLDPGVWLTFERITIKGFRPVMGPDFAFLCYSPDAFLYQSDVVVDLPIGVLSSLLVPSLLSTPRIGVPGVQAAHAWDESYCFDTVHTSQCYPESVHLVDFAGTVPGTGSSGGYVVRFMNSTDTAAEVLDPTCIEEYGSSQCYTDAVAAQIKIDFPSSPPPVPPPRPPKSPHPDAPFAPYPPVAPPASERSSVIVVVPAVVVPCVALLAIAAFVGWWFWRRRHPLPLHVRFPKPRAGPHTTLVVTDIQDSTNMWETLPGDVMDESLVTHNAIMRRCLSKYHGWESATEGDAFIMAFHTATDAVSFCLAVQEQLMTAEWPAELLAHASACEVYATPTKMLQLDFGMVETMKSMACNDSSHPGRITLARHNSNPNSMSIDSTNHPPPHTPPATLRTNALFNGAAAKSASKVSHSPSGNSSLLASADNLNALHMMLGAALESVVEGCGEDEGDAMLSNRTWLEHLRNGWLLRSGAKQVAGPDAAEGSFVDAGGDIGDLRHIGISNGQRLHLPQVRFNNELMMFRGLRVRMGVHSGVVATDISHNKSAARTQYVGPSLSRARNVCDATPGGAVLLSKAAFVAVTTEGGRKQGVVMAHVGDFQKEAPMRMPMRGARRGPAPPAPQAPIVPPGPASQAAKAALVGVSEVVNAAAQAASKRARSPPGKRVCFEQPAAAGPSAAPAPKPSANSSPAPPAAPAPKPSANPSPAPSAASPKPTANSPPAPSAAPPPKPSANPSPAPSATPPPKPSANPSPAPRATSPPKPSANPSPPTPSAASANANATPAIVTSGPKTSLTPLSRTQPPRITKRSHRCQADAPPSSKPLRLYAAVRPELLARYVAGAPLKVAEKVSGGVFDAPVGSVTINFMYMPCHKTLSAWRPELADLAAATFSILVMACVHKNNGYVVEHDGGFCLSAFCRAVDAVIFCIDMKAAMMKAQWSAELLEHELCEEVTEGKCVVMRGPRVKSGTDSCSQVFTAINPSSGRMEYRGKVMNRAARIASKATSGVALVSSNCFAECRSAPEGETISARLHSTLDLKGIGKLEVVQLSMPLHLRIDAIRAFDSVGRITSHLPTADEAPAAPMSETASVGTQSDAMPVMQTALPRIIQLNPGVWLTFEQITMKGFLSVIGKDFDFMCYSPNSFLYQKDVVAEYPISWPNAWVVEALQGVPRVGVPGVQTAHAWNGSYCFDTVHTSHCYPESMHLVDFASSVTQMLKGLGGSGYISWYVNTTQTAAEVMTAECIAELGSDQCYADAVVTQMEIDFPSSPLRTSPTGNPETSGDGQPDETTSNHRVDVVVPVVVSCVAALLIAVLAGWWYKRHYRRRREALAPHLLFAEPQPGPNTTLVVTDIQDSTNMWETLPGDVMDESLVTHNTIMQRCLSEHHGVKSATEGDSFIMAFHTATDAVLFCLAVQEQLMAAEWPAELLAHASACEVFATPTTQLQLHSCTQETLVELGMGGDNHTLARMQGSPSISASSVHGMISNSLLFKTPSATPVGPAPPTSLRTTALIKGATASLYTSHSPGGYSSPNLALAVNLNALHGMLGARLRAVVNGGEDVGDAVHINRTWLEHLRNGWLLRYGAETDIASSRNVSYGATRSSASSGKQSDLPAKGRVSNEGTELMLFRGLRVRMGMHSGVTAADISHNKASARTQYGGSPLACARDVCSATPGGAVLLSRASFSAVTTQGRRVPGAVMAHVGDFRTEAESQFPGEALSLYAAVRPQLLPRYVAGAPLKIAEKVSGGVFDAPVGSVTINFMSMPCYKTLCAWQPKLAHHAASTFSSLVMACLHKHNGYVVEHDDGFCLSAFCRAVDAIHFCSEMKVLMMTAPWPAELLEHELCQEVTEGGCVVLRGPRVKSGTDSCSQVFTAINPSSGRMEYRGKVMNRAARIAAKASSGVSLVSGNCWAECQGTPRGEDVFANPRGSMDLKGIGNLGVFQLHVPLPDASRTNANRPRDDDALAHTGIGAVLAFGAVGSMKYLAATTAAPPAPTVSVGTQWEPQWETMLPPALADAGVVAPAPAVLDTHDSEEATSV
ncbi:hypothetical protein FOA52_010977 [Chlamydomonas sp. UWO 241]|nr:hypothetical protein FOA52_010977 [Chlamydomonas sp. UWO 241]